jgi:hypothetical protein
VLVGLSITVGIIAYLAEDDPECADREWPDFDLINDILREHGLPEHEEPRSLPILGDRAGLTGFPYSFLHYLRRFYARRIAHPNQMPPPMIEGEDPTDDPVVDDVGSLDHLLLWHSDCEGYYIPIDFPEILGDDRITGAMVGSSVRLLDELILVAEPLGIVLHDRQLNDADAKAIAEEDEVGNPYWIERQVWLTLFEAARLSIEHRAAIHFG